MVNIFTVEGSVFNLIFGFKEPIQPTVASTPLESQVLPDEPVIKPEIVLSETPDLDEQAAVKTEILKRKKLLQKKYFVKEHDSMEKISAEQSVKRVISNFISDQKDTLKASLQEFPAIRALEQIFLLLGQSSSGWYDLIRILASYSALSDADENYYRVDDEVQAPVGYTLDDAIDSIMGINSSPVASVAKSQPEGFEMVKPDLGIEDID